MRTVILALTASLVTTVAQAQGTVQFLNSTLSKVKIQTAEGLQDAPVGTVIGLFWGESANNPLSRVEPTTTLTSPGVFGGGTVYAIPGTTPGQQVYLKIAGWWNPSGPTPPEPNLAIYYGETATVSVNLGPTAGPGTVIWQGATGTNPNRMKPLILVPEPSVLALGGAALSLLALSRPFRKLRETDKPSQKS